MCQCQEAANEMYNVFLLMNIELILFILFQMGKQKLNDVLMTSLKAVTSKPASLGGEREQTLLCMRLRTVRLVHNIPRIFAMRY